MRNSFVLGIDPGANGGICLLASDGEIVSLCKMPPTPQDVLREIEDCANLAKCGERGLYCVLEKVGGMPGQGGSASFNFGKGFGHLEMALLALGVKTMLVTPQKWQKHYQLGSASQCASKTEWKNKLKACAQRLFPKLPSGVKAITLATADALLIAEYGRTQFGNE